MGRSAAVLLALPLLLAGCQSEEYSLLLTIDGPETYVDEMEVEVRPLERDGTSEVARMVIARDVTSTAPLRVAVSLPGPLPVAVRIFAPDAGGAVRHGAFRCYQVDGVVEDTFNLVPSGVTDADGDGWPGDLAAGCGEPCDSMHSFSCPASLTDCADDDRSVNPGVIEVCGPDLDCDGEVMPCADEDEDGYPACPPGTRDGMCDCNDLAPEINPGIMEPCPSPSDLDCDGRAGDICDRDGDGSPGNRPTSGVPDCDDTNPLVYPGADEVCTAPGDVPVDENCNGAFDEIGCGPDDLDGDGVLPAAGDCDDCESGRSPMLAEVCGDGTDQDCDTTDAVCAVDDTDGDGVRAIATGGRDCDDTNAEVFPGAPERCSGRVDEDCDGAVDEGCAMGDVDGDDYVEDGALLACEGDPGRTPGLTELCDGIDQDCDGVVDEQSAPMGQACIRDGDGVAFLVDYSDSMEHCGECRNACDPLGADGCVDGACECSSNSGDDEAQCDPGLICCIGMGPAGGCLDLASDFDACGACDNACDDVAADVCKDGACGCGMGSPCGGGLTCCDGQCVDLDEDPNNCSACGSPCGRRETCEGGLCTCFDDQADDPGRDACTGNDRCCRGQCRNRNSC